MTTRDILIQKQTIYAFIYISIIIYSFENNADNPNNPSIPYLK